MAVKRIIIPNKWVGLAGDTKPTVTTYPRVRDGDTFLEYDTGRLYITHDGTNWVVKERDGIGYTSQPTTTRPADTTQYTAGDVVGGAITFTKIGAISRHIIILDADLRYDVTAVPSGMTSFTLYLYNITPPSAIADNAAWDLPAGDRASYLGYILLGSPVDVGSTLFVQQTDVNQPILMGTTTSLFGYLVTTGTYTPAANSETLAVRLSSVGL